MTDDLPDLALRLAERFLGAAWTPDALFAAGRDEVRRGLWWRVELCASAALNTYRRKPLDRPRELAETLLDALAPSRVLPTVEVRQRPAHLVPQWPVRPIPDAAALAALAEVALSELQWYADVRGMQRRVDRPRLQHYRYLWRPSSRRPARLIEAPKDRLKLIQRRILRDVLSIVPVSPIAHGYVPGRSVISAADAHVGAEVLVHFDLASFFPSVGFGRVRAIFDALGYAPGVARDLAGLTTTATPVSVLRARPLPPSPSAAQLTDRFHADRRLAVPHLPQGAPTSPALANLACIGLDRRLAGVAAAFNSHVTRYADDITFSGGFWLRQGVRDLMWLVREIVVDEGFAVARAKTRVTTQSGRQQVLGVVVNTRRNLDRRAVDALKATLANCVRTGPAVQNRAGHPDFRAHLLGRLAWVSSVAPDKGARLRAIFDQIDWTAGS